MNNPLKSFWQTLAIVGLPSFLIGASIELFGLTSESVTASAAVLIAVTLTTIAAQHITWALHKRTHDDHRGGYFDLLYMQILISQTINLILIDSALAWGYMQGIVGHPMTNWVTAVEIGGGSALFAALLVWRQNSELCKLLHGKPAMVFSMYYYVPLCFLMLGSMAPGSNYITPILMLVAWACIYTSYVRVDRWERKQLLAQ